MAAMVREETGVVAGALEVLWAGGCRWGAGCNRSLGITAAAVGWCSTVVMLRGRGRLHFHWGGGCI